MNLPENRNAAAAALGFTLLLISSITIYDNVVSIQNLTTNVCRFDEEIATEEQQKTCRTLCFNKSLLDNV